MKELLNSTYQKFFLIGLLCYIVASWFSLGYHQIDEHFMILEYANFKFGLVPKRVYPWEFLSKIRPTLQPTFVYYTLQGFKSLGIIDPFFQVFLLRLFTAILAWFITCKAILRFSKSFLNQKVVFWTIASITCFWFMPYLQVRFSSENYAGITFVIALLVLPSTNNQQNIQSPWWRWMLIGFLLSCSFYFRFQMAFAILGLLLWLMLYVRPLFKIYFFLLIGALFAIGLNLLVDYWFYGEWILTPLRYYEANITKDLASSYGTTPWYDYFILFITQGVPPISIILLVLFFVALIKRPNQLLVFVFIPFLLGHMFVPHKEFRFLYPMVIPFLLICFSGLDEIWKIIQEKKWLVPSLKVLVWFNLLLLGYRCVWPAKPNHFYYNFLYHYANGKPLHLITLGKGIYDEGHNEIYLYRPKGFVEDTMPEIAFAPFLQTQNADSLLVLSYQAKLPYTDSRYNTELVYVYLPKWIVNIQLNDWQSRSDIWTIWMLRKKE
jgi:phosphatidylinositol glycan class B